MSDSDYGSHSIGHVDGPLADVTIADFTSNMSGPYATMILGDQGANVVKIEPPEGDPIRRIGTQSGGLSAYFANLNRSKRSVVMDLRVSGAQLALDAILDRSDVVVVNSRPGVSVELGIDAETVRQRWPRVIYVEIVGFGSRGPFANRPAYDHVIQALAGFASAQADRTTGEPALVRQALIDKVTGLVVAQAITAALLERGRTGTGRTVQVSMLDVALAFLWPDGMMNHTICDPEEELPSIANSFRLTKTRDGSIAFMVVTGQQWLRLLDALDIDAQSQMDTAVDRMRNGGAFMRKIAANLSTMTSDEAVSFLSSINIPVAPVVDAPDLPDHPQVVANEAIAKFTHPVLGKMQQANPAVRFDGESADVLRPAPTLGQHNAEVLIEHGLSDADIAALQASGVLASDSRSDPSS